MEFKWQSEQQAAFDRVKELITSTSALAYFDVNSKTRIVSFVKNYQENSTTESESVVPLQPMASSLESATPLQPVTSQPKASQPIASPVSVQQTG